MFDLGSYWRREGDSNPRYAFTYARFPSVCLKPLNHLSIGSQSILTQPESKIKRKTSNCRFNPKRAQQPTRRLSDTKPQFLRGKKRDCPSPVLKQKRFNKAPSPIFSALCVFLYAEGTPFRNFRSRRICRRAVCRACPPANPPARAPYPCFRKA